MNPWLRAVGSVFAVALIGLIAGCSGEQGQNGAAGSTGSTGSTGVGGASSGTGATGGGHEGGAGQGGGAIPPPPPTEEDAGSFQADDSWIFSEKTIHTVEISLPAKSIAQLDADGFTYVQGDFVFDDIAVPNVGVRLRGKIGSFRTLDGKPKFKVEFDNIVPKQRFFGLESMSLNNEVVDCSYLKEPLAYRIFALAGVPQERIGFAKVSVNGADYGLYVIVETPDARWLKRAYKDYDDGNFYDGKYIWYGGLNYTLLDFGIGVDDLFQLEEGVDVGHKDISAISNAVNASFGSGQFTAGMDPIIRWDEWHRELAAEQWTGHNDGYALNTNNYRIYFNPEDKKAQVIPWDFDYAFLHDSDWGLSWTSPKGRIAAGCFQDPQCAADQKAAVQALISSVDPAALLTWFNEIDALTLDAASSDPRRECAAAQIVPSRDNLRAWISGQNAQLKAFWGL